MRIAFHRQMAPRGAHPPDAKFLKVPLPVLPYKHVTTKFLSDKLNKQKLLQQKNNSTTKNLSLLNQSSDTSLPVKKSDDQLKIPYIANQIKTQPSRQQSYPPTMHLRQNSIQFYIRSQKSHVDMFFLQNHIIKNKLLKF